MNWNLMSLIAMAFFDVNFGEFQSSTLFVGTMGYKFEVIFGWHCLNCLSTTVKQGSPKTDGEL